MSGIAVPSYITIVQFEVQRSAHSCGTDGDYPFVVWVEREPFSKCAAGLPAHEIRVPDAEWQFVYKDDGKVCSGWVCPCMGRFVE